jgi:hypothetical protein
MGPGNGRARLGGDLTPGERLARRRWPPAKPATDEERRSIAAAPYRDRERAAGRLPASGRPHDTISLERNRDYPADSDLCFGAGNSGTRVRVTGSDLHGLRSLLLDQGYDLSELKDRAAGYMRDALDEADPDIAEWAARNTELAVTAHAAGYRLAVGDQQDAAQDVGYVRDFLAGLGPAAGADQQAIERVIALLEAM